MINIFLVRHGEAAASWAQSPDPGLSALGAMQAADVADALADRGPFTLVSSPLRRAQETAAPLAARMNARVEIDPRFREIPASVPFEARSAWLAGIMQSRWDAVDDTLHAWREAAWNALAARTHDAVIFTHFMVINAVVGRVCGDERLVTFEPDNGSITHLALEGQSLVLKALGRTRTTVVG